MRHGSCGVNASGPSRSLTPTAWWVSSRAATCWTHSSRSPSRRRGRGKQRDAVTYVLLFVDGIEYDYEHAHEELNWRANPRQPHGPRPGLQRRERKDGGASVTLVCLTPRAQPHRRGFAPSCDGVASSDGEHWTPRRSHDTFGHTAQ